MVFSSNVVKRNAWLCILNSHLTFLSNFFVHSFRNSIDSEGKVIRTDAWGIFTFWTWTILQFVIIGTLGIGSA
ncbi:unnamed protein product [Allacma fusca]|uniref:Uncharacterized protein n=1 Tax=Allacma fusca TaxID=39272 RepID=A0A8J2J6C5_9HEXA|nr:unnamed protein product [Allacma fusca]